MSHRALQATRWACSKPCASLQAWTSLNNTQMHRQVDNALHSSMAVGPPVLQSAAVRYTGCRCTVAATMRTLATASLPCWKSSIGQGQKVKACMLQHALSHTGASVAPTCQRETAASGEHALRKRAQLRVVLPQQHARDDLAVLVGAARALGDHLRQRMAAAREHDVGGGQRQRGAEVVGAVAAVHNLLVGLRAPQRLQLLALLVRTGTLHYQGMGDVGQLQNRVCRLWTLCEPSR